MSESYTNETKHPTTFTNVERGSADLTWDEANFTWAQGGGTTWDDPYQDWENETKHTTTFANQVKH